jgi:alkylation response protein AidB-like acyl-CoA dehydrogenase
MDFELTASQVDLAEAVARLLAGEYPLDVVRSVEGAPTVVDRARWSRLAATGVFSLRLAEGAGGAGLGLADATLVFEELGRALVPGPLVASHLAAGLVGGAAEGTTVVGLVVVPPGGADVVVPVVLEHLADVDMVAVLDDDGVALVAPTDVHATAVARPLDPLTPVWTARALPRGEPVAGPEVAARWRRDGTVLTAALQVGLARATTELAAGYASERHQFGRPIGSFQAVKHLCADMEVRGTLARVAVQAAGVTADQTGVGDPAVAAAEAQVLADDAAVANGRACVQVHGGTGFTWESPVHLYLKRARVHANQFVTAAEAAAWLGATIPVP